MVIWNKKEYMVECFDLKVKNIENFFFDREKQYKFKVDKFLGEGTFGIVNRYKIKIISSSGNSKDVYLAGKFFKNIGTDKYFRQYVLKLIYLSNIGIKEYSTLRILDTRINRQKDIKFLNIFKKKINLSKVVFFSDLTMIEGVEKVIPLNSRNSFNVDFLGLKREIRFKIYEKVLIDISILIKNNLFIRNLDLWMILISKTKDHRAILIDVDMVYPFSQFSFKTNEELLDLFKKILRSALDDFLDLSTLGKLQGFNDDYHFLLNGFKEIINLK